MPKVVLIGGPNGAGKSTLAPRLLPLLGVTRFVNADLIARGLSPLDYTVVGVDAGKQMLRELHALREARQPFAFESTLASRTFARFLAECADAGYETHLAYVWVRDAAISLRRVARRVEAGGHFVPDEDVRRRWKRSAANLFSIYMPVAYRWRVWENADERGHRLVAGGSGSKLDFVVEEGAWTLLKKAADADS